jgi:hypothetical protein
MNKPKDALTRIADVVEGAQFSNGSLDVTVQGPESGWVGSPVSVKLFFVGNTADSLIAELSGIAIALLAIADAIKERK